MELISLCQYSAAGTQVRTPFEPLQMALSRVGIGILLLNQPLKRLGQQAGDRSLPFHGNKLDLEQDFPGN